MPLRAILDGMTVIAPDLDTKAWSALKTRRSALTMPCCSSAATMRVSSRGLQHFAHKTRRTGEFFCDWKPETEEHLHAKMAILAACRATGWSAQPEARAEDGTWRADVLAWRETSHSRTTVAFEVQLSRQRRDETEARQSRYAAAGVRGCWFIQPRSSTAKYPIRNEHFRNPAAELPAFRILFLDDGTPCVGIPTDHVEEHDRILPLNTFVSALLSGGVRFAAHKTHNTARRVRVFFLPIDCWRCGKAAHFYILDAKHGDHDHMRKAECRSACGRRLHFQWTSDPLRPDVVDAVITHLKTSPITQVHLGAIKPRFIARFGFEEISFGCPECDAVFGPYFLSEKADYFFGQ